MAIIVHPSLLSLMGYLLRRCHAM